MIDLMYTLSKQARSEGLLSLEAKAEELQDPFLKRASVCLLTALGKN